jgi:hypothetical protein
MTLKNIQIDFNKIGKRDQEFIYEMLADYIIEHELPEDVAPHDGDAFVFSYSIDIALEIFDDTSNQQ